MVELTRTVRLPVGVGPRRDTSGGYAGSGALDGLMALHEIDVTVRGVPDATGYLLDIKTIDRAVVAHVAPVVREAFVRPDPPDAGRLMAGLLEALATDLPVELASIRWRQSPFHEVNMTTTTTSTVAIRQRFEFAASHRLHVPTLSDEENRRLFGKCNNANGHGHNYIVEPCVHAGADSGYTFADLARATHEAIIEHFDHKHLNLDVAEFGEGRQNPSVENIARVSYERLAPLVKGAELHSVTVWETDRTCATYPASE